MKILGEIHTHCHEDSFIVEINKAELRKLTNRLDLDREFKTGMEIDVGSIYNRLVRLDQGSGLLKQYTEQLRGIAMLLEPLSGYIKDACEISTTQKG
mgnify:CR=1 FL=1